MSALRTWPAHALALLLAGQAVAYYAVASRADILPSASPLSTFPPVSADWRMEHEYPIEKEVSEVLRADDTLNRVYRRADRSESMFIAFFKTQRFGPAPHSPKHCLPGAGWQPVKDRTIPIEVPGRTTPILVNEYVIERGDQRSLVLY